MTSTPIVTVDYAVGLFPSATGKRTPMSVSTAANCSVSTLAAAANPAQEVPNVPATSPTTSAGATALAHSHLITIEVDPDRRHDGRHPRQEMPFWKGFVEEYEDPTGYVAVAFARADDDSNASRASLIVRLNEVVRRNGYLLHRAEDRSTGNPIEGMPCSRLSQA